MALGHGRKFPPLKKIFSYIVGLLNVAFSLITSGSCCITPSKSGLRVQKSTNGTKALH